MKIQTENSEFPFIENPENKNEKVQDMRDCLYELYKLDWMASHNHSVDELFEEIKDISSDLNTNNQNFADLVEDALMSFELDKGFGGELWVCYDEFLECEYQDFNYMDNLIDRLAPSERKTFLFNTYRDDMNSLLYGKDGKDYER